jgi:hypothetical protein
MNTAKSLTISLDVVVCTKLVWVVSLAVNYRKSISDKLVHAVVAGADAHLGHLGRVDGFFDKSLAGSVLIPDAVA